MLPDFPILKHEIENAISKYVERRARQLATGLSEIPERRHFEGGGRNAITRPGEPAEETKMVEIGGEITLSRDDLRTMPFPQYVKQFESLADQLAEGKSKMFFAMVEQSVEKVGNKIDAKGRPFSFDVYHEMMEKMSIEFGPDGKPELPTMIVSPEMAEKIAKVAEEEKDNVEIEIRNQKLIEKKREEWRAREASRILVG
jgi:hypothetical protein